MESSAVAPTSGGESVDRFRVDIFDRGTFSEDWYLRRVNTWPSVFRELEGRQTQLLEIGSYEGLSACFMLWRLPEAVITCIDTFEGGIDDRASNADLSRLESTFDANVALIGAARVKKLVGDSRRCLLDLGAEHARFDLVYVDGSHLGLDVIVDAALAWSLVETGGILIFDDYGWAQLGDDPLLRPGVAIDAFLDLVAGKYETLFAEHQLAIRKLLPTPQPSP
jgi:predicted O-methyltransferase YrrM